MSRANRADAAGWVVVFQILPITVKELNHLRTTADRLRALAPDLAWAESLETDVAKAEMLDAFVARLGRLQDTLGDKLLPALLRASQERIGTQRDNLLRAEKRGWIDSAEGWIALRTLRNRLVQEHVGSAAHLLEATLAALDGVVALADVQKRLTDYAQGYADRPSSAPNPGPTGRRMSAEPTMRLTPEQIQGIRPIARQLAGERVGIGVRQVTSPWRIEQ